MLFFVGRNTPTPVRSPSKQKLHTYQHILTSIFNVNTNSTGWCTQLSVAKSFNPLFPININLQLVVYTPCDAFTFATRTTLSTVENISMILPNGQFTCDKFLSAVTTKSTKWKFWVFTFQFFLCTRRGR